MPRRVEVDRPAWFWWLIGFIAARVVLTLPETAASKPDLEAAVPYVRRQDLREERTEPSVRELRTVPGVGQLRALAIARARWSAEREGREFQLTEIRGIGPTLAAQLAAWSAEGR